MNKDIDKIQDLLDKYMAGETSNEEEALLRDYFDTYADDIPEEWKAYKALFCFVGFERLNLGGEANNSEEKAKGNNLIRIATLSVAVATAIILLITGIAKIDHASWSANQPECYAVIDGKVYTNPKTVHAEALNALADMASDQDDAFDALDMMR